LFVYYAILFTYSYVFYLYFYWLFLTIYDHLGWSCPF